MRYWFVMPIDDLQQAAQKIAGFLASLNKLGGLRLKYRITAGDGARDPESMEARQIYVELGGPDVPLVTQHNGELLHALETLVAQMLRLELQFRLRLLLLHHLLPHGLLHLGILLVAHHRFLQGIFLSSGRDGSRLDVLGDDTDALENVLAGIRCSAELMLICVGTVDVCDEEAL